MANSQPTTTDQGLQQQANLALVLAVPEVERASLFYQKLGFREAAAFPRADGRVTVAFLRHGSSMMLLGRLDEQHYENETRARAITKGPRGLGATVLLNVTNLAEIHEAMKAEGVEILLDPVDEFYGDRVFFFLDPYGYEWKISQTIREVSQAEVAETIGNYHPR
jgi:uncharacterized glyoxalase superfamily protein PhnB